MMVALSLDSCYNSKVAEYFLAPHCQFVRGMCGFHGCYGVSMPGHPHHRRFPKTPPFSFWGFVRMCLVLRARERGVVVHNPCLSISRIQCIRNRRALGKFIGGFIGTHFPSFQGHFFPHKSNSNWRIFVKPFLNLTNGIYSCR